MKPYCHICLENHAISNFKHLGHCGHTLCSRSVEELFRKAGRSNRIDCPFCRAPVTQRQIHPIYLDFKDPDVSQSQDGTAQPVQEIYSAEVLTELVGLHASVETINTDSSADYIKKTAQKLQNAFVDVDKQSCAVTGLLCSIACAFERLAGGIATLALHRDEVLALRRRLKEEQRDKTRVLEDKARVQRELKQASEITADALEAADTAATLKTAADRRIAKLEGALKEGTERHKSEMAEKSGEITRLQATLLEHKAKEAKQKARIAELKQRLQEQEAVALANRNRPLPSSSSLLVTPISTRSTAPRVDRASYPARHKDNESFLRSTPDVSESEFTERDNDADDSACLPALFPTPPDDTFQPSLSLPTKFTSDWNFTRPGKRKRIPSSGEPKDMVSKNFPIKVDHQGRPQGLMQLGSRQREKFG